MTSVRLTKRIVQGLSPRAKPYITFDADLKGFGVRTTPTGRKVWIIEYRANGGGRGINKSRLTFGSLAEFTPDEARETASKLLAGVRLGDDPAAERASQRAALTVTELAEKWLREDGPTWSRQTLTLYRSYLRNHIIPALGTKRARDVSRADVVRLHRRIGETAKPTANRVAQLLSAMFNWAASAGDVAEGVNPAKAKYITRFKEHGRERYLTADELARLGDSLREAETIGLPWEIDPKKPKAKHAPKPENRREIFSPFAIAALRLLLLTGCRLREILSLRWEHVDFERGTLLLPDAKTGRRYVLLSGPALEVLASLPRLGPLVVPGRDPEKPRADLNRPWQAVAKRAGLTGVRLHDLRHSFASVGAGAGLGLPVIGKLLGHRVAATTSRYSHLADDPIRRATEMIGAAIASALGRWKGKGEIVAIEANTRDAAHLHSSYTAPFNQLSQTNDVNEP